MCLSETRIFIQVLGTAKPSFTARLIEDHQEAGGLNADTEEDIKGVAGTLYAAAEDTVCFLSPQACHRFTTGPRPHA